MYKFLFFLILVFPVALFAHKPFVVEFAAYKDIYPVSEPEVSQAFYGNLTGFPHRYEFTLNENQPVFMQVLVPDIEGVENNRSGVLVRKKDDGTVTIVGRMNASDASWETVYEPFGGDSYRDGATYESELPAGDYLVEISTAENLGKYVFVIGELEDFSDLGYFGTLGRIYEVKRFFDKPPIAVFQSPFYYVPFGILVLIGVGTYLYRRKRHA